MLQKPHVIMIGFQASDIDSLDFDHYRISMIAHTYLVDHLPSSIKSRFVGIAKLEVPHNLNLNEYIGAFTQLEKLTNGLIEKHGEPHAFIGLYEHTTIPAAMLREKYHIPGISLKTATTCRDKVKMKETLRGTDIKFPNFMPVSNKTTKKELVDFISNINGRVVLKPRSQAASIGVHIFDNTAQLLNFSQQTGFKNDYEIEVFVEGQLCHMDAVIRNSKFLFFSAAKYMRTFYEFSNDRKPFFAITIDDPDIFSKALSFSHKVMDIIQIKDGVFHLEAFLTPEKNFIFLEIACRFGGTGIPPMFKSVYGVDIVKEQFLAETYGSSLIRKSFSVIEKNVGAWLNIPPTTKIICRAISVEGVDQLPRTITDSMIARIGDRFNETEGPFSTVGRFAIKGNKAKTVELDCQRIINTYKVEVKELFDNVND